jgi:hypothetical protein
MLNEVDSQGHLSQAESHIGLVLAALPGAHPNPGHPGVQQALERHGFMRTTTKEIAPTMHRTTIHVAVAEKYGLEIGDDASVGHFGRGGEP